MTMSGVMYFSRNPDVMKGFEILGFPLFFINILGLAKLLGAIALVAPVGHRLKEWAYAGFLFTFIGAIWAHVVTSTSFAGPVVALVLLGTSYLFWNRISSVKTA